MVNVNYYNTVTCACILLSCFYLKKTQDVHLLIILVVAALLLGPIFIQEINKKKELIKTLTDTDALRISKDNNKLEADGRITSAVSLIKCKFSP